MANQDQDQDKTIENYMERINARLLRGSPDYYDPETKEYMIGTFYVHEGLDYFEFREVTDEKGGYRNIGNVEFASLGALTNFLEGFLAGHYETCDTLDVEIEESEVDLDTYDPNDEKYSDLSQEERDALSAMKAQREADKKNA